MTIRTSLNVTLVAAVALAVAVPAASFALNDDGLAELGADAAVQTPASLERIDPYKPRYGRERPVIAVLGENGGTELTDFAIPHGILAQSGVADVFSVGIRPGVLAMRPALGILPDSTAAEFDARFPEGADYVVVPAMVKRDDRALLDWLRGQSAKGATIVSICDGALVVAKAGLLNGHRATAHWATLNYRRKAFPNVRWIENARYVADGRMVSSAGISAAIPTALALVEAIGGREKALDVGRRVGVPDWSSVHNSQVFAPKVGNLKAYATKNHLNGLHRKEAIGIAVAPGVDEIALALTADAYTRSGRGQVYSFSSSRTPVRTSHGLTIMPDRLTGAAAADRMVSLPAPGTAPMLDIVLGSIARDYGRSTAFGVALDFEYPGFHD